MKNDYDKNVEQGIKKTTLLSSTIIILVLTIIIGSTLILTEYNNFKKHINNFKDTVIKIKKAYIKMTVENLLKNIEFEEEIILNGEKQRIKKQSIIAYNLSHYLYEKTKFLTKKEQISFIKDAINQISKNDVKYFIIDKQGRFLLNSEKFLHKKDSFLDFEDINGFKFINKIVNSTSNKQNFVQYYWYKPKSNIMAKKITYSRTLKELNITIGSGDFVGIKKDKLIKRVIKKIFSQNYNEKEFIIMYKINSLNNIIKSNKLLTNKHIIPNKDDLAAIKSLLINTNYKGNDYIYYENNSKILYGTFIKHLKYFIGMGINLSEINDIIEKERLILLKNLYTNIIKLVIIMLIMIIIFFIISLFFTQKIKKLFSKYKKKVIINEHKYHLLFNHSNDGFIISHLNKKKALIISCNKKALKVSQYKEEELLKKDFFELFLNLDKNKIIQNNSYFKIVKLQTKNSHIRTIELNLVIYSYDKEDLLFASLRDITERIILKEEKLKQEEMLIQKSKMAAMGEMIGNIAHQWRQPLTQISGLFFDIESAYDYKELNKKYLSNRVNEANDLLEYMSKTIDDFRHFFKPNSKIEPFLVMNAVTNAINIVNTTLKHYKIKITTSVDSTYQINGYKNEYSQAVLNIISNAKDILIDRKIKNPTIKIYLLKEDKMKLCIEDNAGGIDEKIMDKIFDPYFTTKYDYGTGIGLYMTKLIIEEKMKGRIEAKNSTKGAIFSIKI